MSRWSRLWKAVKVWWRNQPPPYPDRSHLVLAKKLLNEYWNLYCQRTNPSVGNKTILPEYGWQAADIVEREGHKRSSSLEAEVRTLALTMDKLISYLELTIRNEE